MTSKRSAVPRQLSCREKRAIFLSIILINCFHSSTSVSALQAPQRQSRSLLSPESLGSSKISKATKGIKRRRQHNLSLSLSFNSGEYPEDENLGFSTSPGMNRREVFSNSAKALFAGLATPFLLDPTDPANAVLLRFPIGAQNTQGLKNTYHFLRAGTSELEVEGIYSTNALFLTNRENALSDEGYKGLKPAIDTLKKTPMSPTVAYHSLAANGMDTGDYIARELKLGRDRLLPEFTYLDQRGIGLWDSFDDSQVRNAVWAMDSMEAGSEGFGGKPPANTDGTSNESLHDQFTRLRQFLSLQETRTSGEIILVIFPDGTGPALLSCMIAGIPYSEAHALEFKPGELRLDITPESIKELYELRKDDPDYLAAIEDGKEKLKELRSMKASDFSTSFKESQENEKQEAANNALIERQKAAALEKQKADEERRAAMQEQVRISKEKKREKDEERKKEEIALKEKKNEKLRAERERQEKKKAEGQAAYVAKKQEQAEKQAASKQRIAEAKEASKRKQDEDKLKQAEAQAAAKRKYEEAQAAAKQKRSEKFEALAAAKFQKQAGTVGGIVTDPSDSPSIFGLSPTVLATAAVGAIGAVFLAGGDDEDEKKDYSAVTTKKDGSGDGSNASPAASSVSTAAGGKATASHATAPISIEKKIHHVPVANTTSISTSSPGIKVNQNISHVPVKATATTTISTQAGQKVAHKKSSPEVSKKTPSKPKPLSNAKETEDSNSGAKTAQSASAHKKNRKPKLKPLTSAKKTEDAEATEKQSISPYKKNRKPKLKPLTNARKEYDSSTSKTKHITVTKERKPKLKPLNSSTKKNEAERKSSGAKVEVEDPEKKFTSKLQAAEQEMKNAFVEAAYVKKRKQQQQRTHQQQPQKPPPKPKSSLFDNNPPVIVSKTVPQRTTNYVYDDDVDDSDWLRVLSEIRDEVEDDDDDDDFGMVDYAAVMNDAQY